MLELDSNYGSVWRKWDLHIHTPASMYQNYGGDHDEIWERFISNLESLPPEVRVIGINDYYFLYGYDKVMEYKYSHGRLSNIDKIFPIIEFRVNTFGSASATKLSKINLHVLFDVSDEKWREELQDISDSFLKQIKLDKAETRPLTYENMLKQAPDNTVASALAYVIPSTDKVLSLANNEYWRDKTLILLGYQEWDDLNKGNQAKLEKEWLYKNSNAFLSASDKETLSKKIQILSLFGDRPLLHSTDIHGFKAFDDYKCYTWIKADPTFDGLLRRS